MEFNGKINLLKLTNACVMNVKGKTGTKKGVFIPIEDNHVYVSTDDTGQMRGAYLNFGVYERQKVSKYGQTHYLKLSVDKSTKEQMSEEERRAIPILGDMKPFEQQKAPAVETANVQEKKRIEDDLPF